jgi:hypothetical protein
VEFEVSELDAFNMKFINFTDGTVSRRLGWVPRITNRANDYVDFVISSRAVIAYLLQLHLQGHKTTR